MKYSTNKKVRKIKEKILNFSLFPVRCICTPIYKLSEKLRKERRYSEKQIKKVLQYIIDYWTDGESEFYIFTDDGYNPFDHYNISTPFHLYSDMSWGWNGQNKKVKNKASHIYYYQKEQYIKILKELCGTPMSMNEKEQWFDKYEIHKIKDREICKIK